VTGGDANINTLTIGKGGGSDEFSTAIGYQALFINTSGNYNTAIGYKALLFNKTCTRNTAIGHQTLFYNDFQEFNTSNDNTAIGHEALHNTNRGFQNTAIGSGALYKNDFNNNGGCDNNTAIGYNALYNNVYGANNVGIGTNSGNSGIKNDSNYNTFLGADTGAGSTGTYNYSTAIGYGALVDTSNQIVLGRVSGTETIKIPGVVTITNTTPATSYTTGALRVSGGASFAGDLYAQNLYISGTSNLSTGGGGGSSVWTTNVDNTIYYNSGNVGIGSSAPSSKLDVNGLITARNAITISSGNLTISNGLIRQW
jgi:hypothetical protein